MSSDEQHPGLSEFQHAALCEYIRYLADNMGLMDWTFRLTYSVPDTNDAAAQIQPVWGKRRADISVAENFIEQPSERQRQFMVHELLHCHFDNLDSLAQNEFRTSVGEIFWNAWHPGFNMVLEQTVDAVAEAWAPSFELITWPESRG